jgi:ferredoxin
MRIELEVEKCIGAGQCVFAAPGLFDQDEDTGIAIVLADSPTPDQAPAAQLAASSCPSSAIHLHP